MILKKKIYLYLIIFGGTSLVFIFLIIPYFLKEIKKNSEDLILFKNELVFSQKEMTNFRELKVIYQSHQDDLDKIDGMFVNSERPIKFINFLNKSAQISQQKIEISPSPPRKSNDEPWSNLSFQVSTWGSFPNFLKFLEKLENCSYLVEIIDLNINKLTENDIRLVEYPNLTSGNVQSTFLIKVFTKSD